MYPTISAGELVYVRPAETLRHLPARFQIVLFKSQTQDPAADAWAMRVVGLPGETVRVDTNSLQIEGAAIERYNPPAVLRDRHWLTGQTADVAKRREWLLGRDELFVVGDNLDRANDSRVWGPLKLSDMIGVAEMKSRGKLLDLDLRPVLRWRVVMKCGKSEPL
jgi:signal peptidase I